MELMRQKAPCLSTVRLPDKSKTESAVKSHMNHRSSRHTRPIAQGANLPSEKAISIWVLCAGKRICDSVFQYSEDCQLNDIHYCQCCKQDLRYKIHGAFLSNWAIVLNCSIERPRLYIQLCIQIHIIHKMNMWWILLPLLNSGPLIFLATPLALISANALCWRI
jgi:hypothetical protein